MDLLTHSDIEGSEAGAHFIPFDVLYRMHPGTLKDASAAYAELVTNYPNYEISMVQDDVKGGVTIYWKRVA